jgi:Family of unknown function (DUF6422)
MSKFPSPEDLTREQSEVLEKAAFLIISARNKAAAMLERAGVHLPSGPFGSPCHARIDGHVDCPCNKYTGDGGPCLTLVTIDPAFPPFRSCGHPPTKHLDT